jgi:glycosyltransferase involved in cell wall biosynthesis
MAQIVIFDNNCTDNTSAIAEKEGVKVTREKKQGKGWVTRAIFEKVDADIYVMVDGDDTYPAEYVHKLIEPILKEEADMVVGNRLKQGNYGAMRLSHCFGNLFITKTLNFVFRTNYQDVLSGYRVFNREFVKNIPLITMGFEIETELTLQALEHGYVIKELPIEYRSRPRGSVSKLSFFIDGYRIMVTIVMLLRDHKPHHLFTFIFIVFSLSSILFIAYAQTNKELFNIFSIVGIILMISAFLFLVSGLILSAVNTRFKELSSIIKKK